MSIASTSKWAVLLAGLVACGGAPASTAPPRSAGVAKVPKAAPKAAREAPLDPDRALGTADALYRDQLAVGARDDRFATDRQVAALRKSIALYEQFIERAAGDPRYLEAVRRSELRIDDARRTIDFLLGGTGEAAAE